MRSSFLLLGLAGLAAAQTGSLNVSNTILRVDNGTYGPPIDEYHYFYDQWPIGLSISSTNRTFVCYTRGDYAYTLGEVVNKTAEAPYPSAGLNLDPSALSMTMNGIMFGSNNSTGLISVQALYITPASGNRSETLWVLDTGRPSITNSTTGAVTMPYGVPGGPKLVGIDLSTDQVTDTYTFPSNVHYPDSYMNDLRFDFRPNVTSSGGGVAYIVDSSNEDRTGFIMLDLATGESWRRLTQDPSTLRVNRAVASYQNLVLYQTTPGMPVGNLQEGLDGEQLSIDGETMFYSPLDSDYLYSIPTSYLLERDSPLREQAAANNVHNLGQRGGMANGFEGDSNGLIYMA